MGVFEDIARLLMLGMALGAGFAGVLEEILGPEKAMAVGAAFGIAFGGAFGGMMLRLPLWPLEAIWQILLFSSRRFFPFSNLIYSAVHWHENSCLPIPFLAQHIEMTAKSDPVVARLTLDACAISPGQREVGQRTLTRLQGKELEQIARDGSFLDFVAERTVWLPPEESSERSIEQFRQVARFLVAASGSSFAQHRLEHLRNADKALGGATVQSLGSRGGDGLPRLTALPAWREAVARRQADAEREAADFLPVPFRAGEPLDPERGREVFRGRESSIGEIEAHLALSTEARSVLLLGPRRTGKSSLLHMLPLMLPDAICVFFDLQGHSVETPEGFIRALVKTTRDQARRSRKINLPDLPAGPPFESAAAWIEALEEALGERRLLICIDEFEALENAFSSRTERLRLLGLLRSTIQHRRKVRLLVSGEAQFDELDPMWDSHFVSVREVRLGHLEPEVAVELVRKPIAEFPDDAIPEDVARRLVDLTGAQPFLVQLLAQLLVSRLNDEKRRSATLADLDAVEEEALGQVGPYFRDLWNRAPLPAREVLTGLARGERPEVPRSARRWLERRCLIREDGALSIPIFGRFLLEEILD